MLLFLAAWGSLAFVIMAPGIMKRAHVRRQNRLLERCRALYMLAVEAIGLGDEATARTYLKRIRRMEQRWRFGNGWPYRLAFALWAIGVGAAGYVLVRIGAIILFGNARLPNADLTFTRRQLAIARRRLVAKLHPDRWHNAAPSMRRACEEALKRVNAAYDRLRPLAA
jgi:hypothetical protein